MRRRVPPNPRGPRVAPAVELSRIYGLDTAAYKPPTLDSLATEGR
jgi:hypothetical protein